MAENTHSPKQPVSAIPPDNSQRKLAIAQPDTGQKISHVGVAGGTYTILLTAKDTAGRFCLIDMHIPPVADRRRTVTISKRLSPCWKVNSTLFFVARRRWCARARRSTSQAGQEEFFLEVGVPVTTRTTPPPKLDDAAQAEFKAKSAALAPKYRTELLESA